MKHITFDASNATAPAHMDHPEEMEEHRLDELVDLQVLAENGDPAAAESAKVWLDRDPDARKQWQDVERVCRLVREEPGAS